MAKHKDVWPLTNAQKKLVEDNLRLAPAFANKKTGFSEEDRRDIECAAYLGIIAAAKKFRKSWGCKFSSYVWRAMRFEYYKWLKTHWNYRNHFRQTDSLDNPDGLGDNEPSYEEPDISWSDVEEAIDKVGLTLDQRYVVARVYQHREKQNDIAKSMTLTKGRVSQIKQDALAKLDRHLRLLQ